MAAVLRMLPRVLRTARLNLARSVATAPPPLEQAVVLGVHSEEGSDGFSLSARAEAYDKQLDGSITRLLKLGGGLKAGKARVLWPGETAVAVVGAGARQAQDLPHEGIHAAAENVRIAAGAGVKALRELARSVLVDDMGAPRAAAEGAALAAYRFQEYKAEGKRKPVPTVLPLANECAEWRLGAIGAESQNWARALMSRPGNKLTPTLLAGVVSDELTPLGVNVIVRDAAWAERERMGCFLSVAQGSAEPPVFIEMHYRPPAASNSQPIVLVGKGVTFDSGGICIKGSAKMSEMRADMGGAAVVCAAMRAAAQLQLPVHIVGLVPATENMPGSRATKPGDIFTARDGKTVEVDNTDAEGRLILCDALCYAHEFKPLVTVDLATLTGAIMVALDDSASGLFTRDEALAAALQRASYVTGDRVWRMPLYQRYSDRMTGHEYVDVHNVGKGKGAGASTAAAFLREFAPARWAHLDIAGVMCGTEERSYLDAGMTGRPLRTLLEFLRTHGDAPPPQE